MQGLDLTAPLVHAGHFDKERRARMTITMYGIKNCDTVKKARVWLDGKITGHELRRDHPLEYQELLEQRRLLVTSTGMNGKQTEPAGPEANSVGTAAER